MENPDSAPIAPELPTAPAVLPAQNAPLETAASERERLPRIIPGVVLLAVGVAAYFVLIEFIIPGLGVRDSFNILRNQLGDHNNTPLPKPETPRAFILMGVPILLCLAGLIGTPLVLAAAAVLPPVRVWLERLLAWTARRPLPAIGFIDTLALYVVYMVAHVGLLGAAYFLWPTKDTGVLVATGMVINDVAMAVALVTAIYLARTRAGGAHGSLGFFPPWSRRLVTPWRPLEDDVILGWSAYPIALAGLAVAAILNRFVTPDSEQHPIVSMLRTISSPTAIAAIVITATAGAAFFEEILFRGVLYNALRRHLNAPAAAILGAFIFSIMHGLPSQLFGLFVLGAILTWLYEKTGRLAAGMVLHFTVNLVSTMNLLVLLHQK